MCWAAPGAADTLGLPPCTPPAAEWRIPRPPRGAPPLFAARDAAEWARAWKAVGGKGAAPTVDFTRLMVVGVTGAAPLAIYRVQLDDAAQPQKLEVRVAERSGFCHHREEPKGARGHLVTTPRSALPVRFFVDRMIDGGLFGWDNEGTDARALGEVPGVARASSPPVLLREDAERRVRATLTADELTHLMAAPTGGRMKRFPHLWLDLEVVREDARWRVRLGDLRFAVDVATGGVSR